MGLRGTRTPYSSGLRRRTQLRITKSRAGPRPYVTVEVKHLGLAVVSSTMETVPYLNLKLACLPALQPIHEPSFNCSP